MVSDRQRIIQDVEEDLTQFKVEVIPVPSFLIQKMDRHTATVWGLVWWKYARGEDDVCDASPEEIGEEIKMKGETVRRHLKILLENDYLKELSTDKEKGSQGYVITEKAIKQWMAFNQQENNDCQS